MSGATLWALIPVLVVVLGFALRQHPARVVLVAALSAGLVSGLGWIEFLDVLGTSFNKARYLLVIVLAFPVIAQMEAHGLRRLAARVVGAWRGVRTGRLLLAYLALRQSSAALGLTSLGGHPQMVRPLLAPMAEAAAEAEAPERQLSDEEREDVRAMSAATDNVGLFFGEDLFLAFGAVLLMQAYFSERGLQLAPLEIALWGIPTAVLAFLIHGARLLWRDRRRRQGMTLTPLYILMGAYFALIAARAARDSGRPRRLARSAFFAILALLLIFGDLIPGAISGALVLILAVIAGFGLPHVTASADRTAKAQGERGYSLLLPVLAIPLVTVILTLSLSLLQINGVAAFDKASAALYGLASACLLALALALRMTREGPAVALGRGGELLEAVGWAFVLPLLLSVLGTLFAKAGVGTALAEVIGAVLPLDVRWVAVLAYGLGMALLTMAMGNAFAAFPVIAGGIGMPFLVGVHGADAAPMAAIGMLSGYCGTLMTPMAANFNLVPVALLDLKDRNAVIRAQIPTAVPLLAGNLCLLLWLCFR